MALCRKCRVREASDIWYDGLCSYCYYEREKNRKKEEQRDREQRESQDRERRYREERDREERRRRDAQDREERQHRERLEELREEEVEYQRQAARDAEIAREEAEEARREAEETRRIAGLKTFTCVRCEANFNEEHGVSAIKSPIGKPLCEDCLSLYAKCDFCKKIFWADQIPIMTFEHVYVDGNPIQKKDIIKKICFGCQNTIGRSFIIEQQELEKKFNKQ